MSASESMFANAARKKYRFPSQRGAIMVEDLFDLSREKLNGIYQSLTKDLKVYDHESLLQTVSNQAEELQEKIAIVKFVFDEKTTQIRQAENAAAMAERNQQIMSIIHDKETQALRDLPVEELKKLLEQQ